MSIVKDLRVKLADLPREIPIFPLDNTVLLPTGELPINVYEPKYLNLVDKALAHPKKLLAITPSKNGKLITDTACAGKIISYIETEDGRYSILVKGLCRLKIIDTKKDAGGFLTATAEWKNFIDDLNMQKVKISKRLKLNDLVRNYLITCEEAPKTIDGDKIANIEDNKLMSFLVANINFSDPRKKEILDAKSFNDFSEILINHLEIELAREESRKTSKH